MRLLITIPREFSNGYALKQTLEGVCLIKKPKEIRITQTNSFLSKHIELKTLDGANPEGFSHHLIIANSNKPINLPIYTKNCSPNNTRIFASSLCYTTNIKREQNYDLYIGRGSIFGNPYSRKDGFKKQECIHNHHYDFVRGILPKIDDIKDTLLCTTATRLGCFCSPEECHGDVYTWFMNQNRPIVPLKSLTV